MASTIDTQDEDKKGKKSKRAREKWWADNPGIIPMPGVGGMSGRVWEGVDCGVGERKKRQC